MEVYLIIVFIMILYYVKPENLFKLNNSSEPLFWIYFVTIILIVVMLVLMFCNLD